ncbi:hypothetical protein HNR62_002024 [Oceanisphaera litoralis]|nr:hypothetical protein [Oceanisphaera litoralis]
MAGCSGLRLEPEAVAKLILLSPADGPDSVLLKQAVVMQSRGENLKFIVVSRFDRKRTRLVALMPTGQSLTTLDYDGQRLQQTVGIPVELPGEAILATIQFSLWPTPVLNRHYSSEAGWGVAIEANRRQLWHHGALVLDIVYDENITRVWNYPEEYQVTIQTFDKRDLIQ